jgi:membrane fusion protein (multidrug efflux system)
VRTLFATAEELRARIADREIELQRAEDDYRRRANLLKDGAVSSEELSHTKDTIAQMRATLSEAREQLNATTVQIDGTTVDTHPLVLTAEAAVRDAALALLLRDNQPGRSASIKMAKDHAASGSCR